MIQNRVGYWTCVAVGLPLLTIAATSSRPIRVGARDPRGTIPDIRDTGLRSGSSLLSVKVRRHSWLRILLPLAISGFVAIQLSACGGHGSAVNPPITVTWQAPTENVDGSALTNLASYNIYLGSTTATLVKTASVSSSLTTYTTPPRAAGVCLFALTAVSAKGAESEKIVHQLPRCH
jgi:hypothetical protein